MTNKRLNSYIVYRAKLYNLVNQLGGRCKRCGNSDISVLDFHHKDGVDKVDNIQNIKLCRLSTLENEVNKCELLCANCHKKEHLNGGRNLKATKNFLMANKRTKCECCGNDDIELLEFHHNKDKKFTISSVLHRQKKATPEDLLEELEKCSVICRNCHRRIHFGVDRYEMYKDQIIEKSKNIREIQSKIDRGEVKRMLESGMKQIEIARHFNASKGTISCIVKELGMRNKQPRTIDRDEVKRMLESGMPQIEIARHFKASKSTISFIVKELGLRK